MPTVGPFKHQIIHLRPRVSLPKGSDELDDVGTVVGVHLCQIGGLFVPLRHSIPLNLLDGNKVLIPGVALG